MYYLAPCRVSWWSINLQTTAIQKESLRDPLEKAVQHQISISKIWWIILNIAWWLRTPTVTLNSLTASVAVKGNAAPTKSAVSTNHSLQKTTGLFCLFYGRDVMRTWNLRMSKAQKELNSSEKYRWWTYIVFDSCVPAQAKVKCMSTSFSFCFGVDNTCKASLSLTSLLHSSSRRAGPFILNNWAKQKKTWAKESLSQCYL